MGEHDGELRVRILFATASEAEAQVRQLIDPALSGQLKFPESFTTRWRATRKPVGRGLSRREPPSA